jgi:AAA+ ATPase superfamily predicted ATPase
MSIFYNREREIEQLTQAWNSDGAGLILLYGRRRVGKTYLLQHFFSDNRPHCYFLASAMAISDNISQLAEALVAAHVERRADGRVNWIVGAGAGRAAALVARLHERGQAGPLWEKLVA